MALVAPSVWAPVCGVTITFGATISETLSEPEAIVAMISIDDGEGTVWQRQATLIVNGQALYLSVIRRNQ